MSTRLDFLRSFLGALGAAELFAIRQSATSIAGTFRFGFDSEHLDLTSDDDDLEHFQWHATEAKMPSPLACQIADLIHRYELLDVDKLKVSRDTLFSIFETDLEVASDRAAFDQAIEALQQIQVARTEHGESIDPFFMRL